MSVRPEICLVCPKEIRVRREDVVYGERKHLSYYSNTCKMERFYSIVLPAGYTTEKKYPVAYILHGIFWDENTILEDKDAQIQVMAGNLMKDGAMEDMILVFPNMYATTDPEQKPSFSPKDVLPYDNFVNELVNDLMPFIAENYSVYTDREHTILAGFSMGGRETLFIQFTHPELFAFAAAISPAPGLVPSEDSRMRHEGQLQPADLRYDAAKARPELLLCCGTQDSVVGKFPTLYHDIMTDNQVEHTWYEVTGEDHNGEAIGCGMYNLFMQYGAYRSGK